jgi:hypothetical protein
MKTFDRDTFVKDFKNKTYPNSREKTPLRIIEAETGLSKFGIWNIVNNKQNIKLETFVAICNYMKVRPGKYFVRKSKKDLVI